MRLVLVLSVVGAAALTALAIFISTGVPGTVLGDQPPAEERADASERGVVSLDVRPGDSARDVAESLALQEVVDSKRRFEALVALLGFEDKLAVGVYDFEPGLLTMEAIERIRAGITSPLAVTIPEGLRLEEIADRLAAAEVVSRSDFLAAARNPANWEGTLAAQRPAGTSLEGYLFPSTYRFRLAASGDDVVRQMLARFDEQFTAERLQRVQSSGRTVHDVLTVASIVEREARVPAERPVIAAVFWNRLAAGMRLAADPTVQYAVVQQAGSVDRYGYWKTELTLSDLAFDSPYNTYLVGGLPPAPIAAPGLSAIDAAILPADTSYLYFVARDDGDGSHAFADTFEEHLDNVERYQGFGSDASSTAEESQ